MKKWLFQILNVLLLEALCMSAAVAIDVETLVMPGEVTAPHAKFESDCSACHKAFSRERQNSLCIDCHQEVGVDQLKITGFHGLNPEANAADCSVCHTEHIGRDASIINFDQSSFNHDFSDFPLLDKHNEVECADCHQPDELFRAAPLQCVACHREDDVHEGGLGEDCASCHAPKGWEVVEFEHEAETGFALSGGHADAVCSDCHAEQKFADTDSQCVACHRDDDEHEGLRGDDCVACHSVSSWDDSSFDHRRKTEFPLLGAHATTTCEQCHVDGTVDVQLETTCIACHRADDEHDGLLGEDCAECHDEIDWADNRFRHDTFTEFPLLGGHSPLGCQSCHAKPVHESNPGNTCIDCHAEDDPHAGQQGEACADCHNETDWTKDVRFDHDFTPFPLIGNHKTAECSACHETSQFQDAPTDCVDCHQDEDVHKGGLGPDCGSCHSPIDWGRWRFDHLADTSFALDGEHAGLRCTECHRTPPRQGQTTSSRCIDCHRSDDVHNGQFGKDCARCHITTTFIEAEER
jgi:hypothetical protein